MSLKILAVVLALAALAAAGCAKTVTEKAIENQTGGKVKVDEKKGTVELKTKSGTVKVGEEKVPSDFPKDIPIYKPSKAAGSMTNTLDGQKSYVLTLTTEDDLDAVSDFYKAGLTDKGWTEKSALAGGAEGSKFATLAYEKGESLVTVTISRDDDKTQFIISAGPKT